MSNTTETVSAETAVEKTKRDGGISYHEYTDRRKENMSNFEDKILIYYFHQRPILQLFTIVHYSC